jgi:hypothetical protein
MNNKDLWVRKIKKRNIVQILIKPDPNVIEISKKQLWKKIILGLTG